jgi:hypothetical protein
MNVDRVREGELEEAKVDKDKSAVLPKEGAVEIFCK